MTMIAITAACITAAIIRKDRAGLFMDLGHNRGFMAFWNGRNNLAINGWDAGTVTKDGRDFVITLRADIHTGMVGRVETVRARTRKAAVDAFFRSYILELTVNGPARRDAELEEIKAANGGRVPIVPTECPTCGSLYCRSRFDCSPGAPNDWQ